MGLSRHGSEYYKDGQDEDETFHHSTPLVQSKALAFYAYTELTTCVPVPVARFQVSIGVTTDLLSRVRQSW